VVEEEKELVLGVCGLSGEIERIGVGIRIGGGGGENEEVGERD